MTNDATRAKAEGLPAINRRRMLLGLAAASTAAATVTAAAAAPAVMENPDLIRLAAELPGIAAAFQENDIAFNAAHEEWQDATPWAPDELTEKGTGHPHHVRGQAGEVEMQALGGYLWREGDEFPRRIVVTTWSVRYQISNARTMRRRAQKSGALADFMAAEAEIERLRRLHAVADAYEREFSEISRQARAWYDQHGPKHAALKEALELHVAAIMREPDRTVEGLLIKAQALAEWDRLGTGPLGRVAFRHGEDWHGQIAASILRHAKGGAS